MVLKGTEKSGIPAGKSVTDIFSRTLPKGCWFWTVELQLNQRWRRAEIAGRRRKCGQIGAGNRGSSVGGGDGQRSRSAPEKGGSSAGNGGCFVGSGDGQRSRSAPEMGGDLPEMGANRSAGNGERRFLRERERRENFGGKCRMLRVCLGMHMKFFFFFFNKMAVPRWKGTDRRRKKVSCVEALLI
jgi:hypothetical protein